MIINIDHIAVSSGNDESVLKTLNSLGYSAVFTQEKKPNLRIKNGLMKTFCEYNELTLLRNGDNVGIEIIGYDHTIPSPPSILPIFEVDESFKEYFVEEGSFSMGSTTFSSASFKEPKVPLLLENSNSFSLSKFIQYTTDVEKSIPFWEALGFKKQELNDTYAELRFDSFFSKKPATLYLMEKEVSHHLDTDGFNCIALVSNSVKSEASTLESFTQTPIERVTINNRDLDILFARSPGGELVEILSPAKKEE